MKIAVALGLWTVMLGGLSVAQANEVREVRYLGYATDLNSGAYRYTEVHRHRYQGSRWLGGKIRYVAPNGQVLAEKTLDFSRDPYIPISSYRLRTPAYEEHITELTPAGITMEKVSEGERQKAIIPRVPNQAADSGFNSWLVDRLDAFARGETLPMRFAVVGQLDQYRFRVRPLGQTTWAGESAVRLRVEPDSLIRVLVPKLEVIYGLRSRDLLLYEGISNILDPRTGKAWSVRIDYRNKPTNAPANLPTP